MAFGGVGLLPGIVVGVGVFGVGVGVGVGVGHGGTVLSHRWSSKPARPRSLRSSEQRSCQCSRSGGAGVSAEPGKTI